MASAARLPLLYAEGSAKNPIERDVNLAVWGAVDGINMAILNRDPRMLLWTDVTSHLQGSVQRSRELVSESDAAQTSKPRPAQPEEAESKGETAEESPAEKKGRFIQF